MIIPDVMAGIDTSAYDRFELRRLKFLEVKRKIQGEREGWDGMGWDDKGMRHVQWPVIYCMYHVVRIAAGCSVDAHVVVHCGLLRG